MKNELNNDDIEILMQALDALESKATREGLLGSMLGMMLIGDKEEAKRQADEEMQKAERESLKIKDTVILLKAKLIQMRDRYSVADAVRFLKETK